MAWLQLQRAFSCWVVRVRVCVFTWQAASCKLAVTVTAVYIHTQPATIADCQLPIIKRACACAYAWALVLCMCNIVYYILRLRLEYIMQTQNSHWHSAAATTLNANANATVTTITGGGGGGLCFIFTFISEPEPEQTASSGLCGLWRMVKAAVSSSGALLIAASTRHAPTQIHTHTHAIRQISTKQLKIPTL